MKTPKTTLLLLLLGLCVNMVLSAQTYFKGDSYLHLGIAVPNQIFEDNHSLQIPLITGSFDKFITDEITVGGSIGFTSSRGIVYRFLGDHYFSSHHYAVAMLRSSYHHPLLNPDKFDTYAGIGLGANIGWSSFYSEGAIAEFDLKATSANTGFVYALFAGIHYQHSDLLKLFAELGLGVAPITVGLQIHL